jgi:hypothetical protein
LSRPRRSLEPLPFLERLPGVHALHLDSCGRTLDFTESARTGPLHDSDRSKQG